LSALLPLPALGSAEARASGAGRISVDPPILQVGGLRTVSEAEAYTNAAGGFTPRA